MSEATGSGTERQRVVILGAAGRDFHDFNVVFRGDPAVEVVAFTANQIPGIDRRRYPPELAGPFYPNGIPIEDESLLETICRRRAVHRVVLAYSDLPHEAVMHLASRALAAGADFSFLGPQHTMLHSRRPVIAVSAVRTGCGKSQTARWIVKALRHRGLAVAAVRHPMPYGDLVRQRVQRFAERADLDRAACTAEEREEYEPYLEAGAFIYAGVDYAEILAQAEGEADVIVWDGGNNDFPFFAPDLHLVVVDALRPDQLTTHHPGEAALRMADVVIVNKVDAAGSEAVQRAVDGVRALLPNKPIVRASSPVVLDDPAAVRGRRVVVVDDGPTLTHGGMAYGAGQVAATAAGAAEIVDPRPWASPTLARAFEAYPHLGRVLPALGYGREQLGDLEATLNASDADVVVSGTPLDLEKLLDLAKPVVRARYEYRDEGSPSLEGVLDAFATERLAERGTQRP